MSQGCHTADGRGVGPSRRSRLGESNAGPTHYPSVPCCARRSWVSSEWRVGGVVVDRPAPARSLFPPPSFPVYGLVSPSGGARCLELFGDPPDGEPHFVSLWHQSSDARSVIMVTTYTRRSPGNSDGWRVPTDEQAAEHGVSALECLASQCTTTLVDLTLPVPSLARPPGLLKALVGHAQTAAEAHAVWATVDWRFDGVAVQAPAWSFAGGGAGFTDAAEDAYVSVVGLGPDASPDGL